MPERRYLKARPHMAVSPVSIVNVGYRSTNDWVISAGRSRVLVDLGRSGTMGTMRANLSRADIPISEIRFGLATHFHIDHAGLTQDLTRPPGVRSADVHE